MMSLIASKHRRSSFQGDYTVSFVGGRENGPPDSRSTRETCPYEMTERTSRMVTPPVFQDDCSSVATSADSRDRLSDTHSIRVLKQMPLPDWMKIFVPRTVRIQTGPEPFMEYTRSEHGEVRQRKLITVATSAERLPKNILAINFNSSEIGKMSASSPRSTASSTSTKPTVSDRNSKVNTDRWVLKFDSKRERDTWARLVQDAVELLAWINKFTLGGEVITTKNSSVFECFTWMDHDTPSFVLKSMTADSKTKTQVTRNEIHVHHLLTNFSTHPNIVNLHDSFRQQDKAYLVLENCVGGDLFEFISQNGAVDERAAKTLFRRIASAIDYVHEQGIVHLDIKPENLFFKASPSQLDTIKLGDFGSAMVLEDVKRGKAALSCTLGYAAPEILEDGDVSFAADVFSAGAVLYMILCGYPPFSAPSEQEILEKTLRCDIEFFEPDWWNVSKEAKALIRGMMHVDPSQRLSMQEVLEHPWLASVGFFVYL